MLTYSIFVLVDNVYLKWASVWDERQLKKLLSTEKGECVEFVKLICGSTTS